MSSPRSSSDEPRINILLTSFPGLGLPRTLSLPVAATSSIDDVCLTIHSLLPETGSRLILTTTDNRQLLRDDERSITSLLSQKSDQFLPLRLSARLCGGKGGFGSQLRAAGGRMSSRKNRQNQQNASGSNRNLDGRRLRTVEEAKRLAEYLAIKPDMEKKEREERKKRWEAVIEAAEKREEEIKTGKRGANQGRLDAEYVEGKETAEEKTREAVIRAMREDARIPERTGSESSSDRVVLHSDEHVESSSSGSEYENVANGNGGTTGGLFGWDEEDQDDSDENDDK